jgi:diguanylate cyclase (GGDEF)-like protein/PAS domain S-box-containing protein
MAKDGPAGFAEQSPEGGEAGKVKDLLVWAEDVSGAGSFQRDFRTGKSVYSPGFRRIYAVPEGVALDSELVLQRVHPEDQAFVEQAIDGAVRDHTPFLFETRVIRFDEVERVIRARGSVELDERGELTKMVGTIMDITEEVEARAARELLSRVVDSSDDAILTKDRDGIITSWNRGAEQLYLYTAEEAIGQPVTIIEPPELAGQQEDILRRLFAGESVHHLETERVRKDGRRLTVSLTASPIKDANGRVVSASVIARDITERRRYEERLRHLADHDQLTGLFNRRRFEEELKRELARARRYHATAAMLSVDLDSFKSINDAAGHAAGDVVLGEVAATLRRRFRSTDVIARLGGDEFAVLLPEIDPEDARESGEELLGALRACRPIFGGKAFQVQASIGVSTFHAEEVTADDVMVYADLAMYSSKAAGRNRVTVYSPREGRQARALVRQPWSERIRQALEHDRFVLHMQPILDLESGAVNRGEFLLRMKDNQERLIAPGAFLPTAERDGLIHAVDHWVVEHAISLIAAGNIGSAEAVGVNLSGETVAGDPALLGLIEDELRRTGADPSKLIFEITETAAIANMPEASSFAAEVTKLGCSLALDDFGTGFGSFYYLKHLPVNYLKLDGEFIYNLPRSKVDEHLVKAIVDVAQALEIETIAESVTDDETIQLLRKHGVDYAQGFHVGEPVPLAA